LDTASPEQETFLTISLNDSLRSCEKVLVQVFDRNDTTRLLATPWNGPLSKPGNDIQKINMKGFGTEAIVVVVSGYKAGGQLSTRTLIFYSPEDDSRTVRHDPVPPLVPHNWLESLAPSAGSLNPPFHRDTGRYTVKLPQGVAAISFTPTAPLPGIIIQANGAIVPSGTATKTFQVGNAPDSVWFMVTDTSTGISSTRDYRVALIPTPPPGLYLASLTPSTGFLGTEFSSENTIYYLYMPPDQDTVSFLASPLDPRTMTVTIDGQAVFPGQQSQVITVAKGTIYTLDIYVRRGGESGYYRILIDHTKTSSH
jgi:hypothetical protein